MQIKIEIDVKPEELRRFLGLPDVAGLQEDLVGFIRDKLGRDGIDAAGLLKDSLQLVRDSGPWKRLLAAARVVATESAAPATPASRPAGAASKSGGRSKRAPRPVKAAPNPGEVGSG